MILIVLGFAVMALITVPPLVRMKYWRELAAFSLLFAFSLTACILQQAGVALPNVLKFIGRVLDRIHFHF